MFNGAHHETEVWRLILLRRNASEIFVFQTEAGFDLPCVKIPSHARIAPALNAQVKALSNLDVYSLYSVPAAASGDASARYHVVEALQYDAITPQTAQWLPIRSLTADQFIEQQDFGAIETWIGTLGRSNPNGHCFPFAKPGWFFDVRDWVQDAISPFRLKLTENFQQFNASSSFSLIRFETDARAVWFKAVGPPNSHEFLVTTTLASRVPEYVPELLATHDGWNGWVTLEADGESLSACPDVAGWQKAMIALAHLQIKSVSSTNEVLAAGARDLRLHNLLRQCDSFFSIIERLMRKQTKPSPLPLSQSVLSQLQQDLKCILFQLQDLDLPDSLGHLDCNPGNVFVSSTTCTFLDWAEAAIGNPAFTYQYLLEYFRRIFGPGPSVEAKLTSAYIKPWEVILETAELKKALQLTPAAAAFANASCFVARRDSEQIEAPETAAWLRSLTRRIHTEVEALRSLEIVG